VFAEVGGMVDHQGKYAYLLREYRDTVNCIELLFILLITIRSVVYFDSTVSPFKPDQMLSVRAGFPVGHILQVEKFSIFIHEFALQRPRIEARAAIASDQRITGGTVSSYTTRSEGFSLIDQLRNVLGQARSLMN
jgi:hypothetical protein